MYLTVATNNLAQDTVGDGLQEWVDKFVYLLPTPNEGRSLQVVDKEEKTPEETKERIIRLADSLSRNKGAENIKLEEDSNIADIRACLDSLGVSNRDSDVSDVDF